MIRRADAYAIANGADAGVRLHDAVADGADAGGRLRDLRASARAQQREELEQRRRRRDAHELQLQRGAERQQDAAISARPGVRDDVRLAVTVPDEGARRERSELVAREEPLVRALHERRVRGRVREDVGRRQAVGHHAHDEVLVVRRQARRERQEVAGDRGELEDRYRDLERARDVGWLERRDPQRAVHVAREPGLARVVLGGVAAHLEDDGDGRADHFARARPVELGDGDGDRDAGLAEERVRPAAEDRRGVVARRDERGRPVLAHARGWRVDVVAERRVADDGLQVREQAGELVVRFERDRLVRADRAQHVEGALRLVGRDDEVAERDVVAQPEPTHDCAGLSLCGDRHAHAQLARQLPPACDEAHEARDADGLCERVVGVHAHRVEPALVAPGARRQRAAPCDVRHA